MFPLPVISPHGCLGPGLDVWPGPHVLVFLLHPAQLGVAILLRHLKTSWYYTIEFPSLERERHYYCAKLSRWVGVTVKLQHLAGNCELWCSTGNFGDRYSRNVTCNDDDLSWKMIGHMIWPASWCRRGRGRSARGCGWRSCPPGLCPASPSGGHSRLCRCRWEPALKQQPIH